MVFAVIRLKGTVNLKKDVEVTLRSLRLNRRNHCIVLDASPGILGMINTVQPYITWGEVDIKTLVALLAKRGKLAGNKRLTEDYLKQKTGNSIEQFAQDILNKKIRMRDVPGLKPIFRLKPPSKGLEEKGMKKPYSLGGAYGYRGKDINELLLRMI